MRITSKPLAAVVFIIIFGGIMVSTWMNWWQTESDKLPAKFTQGDFIGENNPLDIRGSYTLGDIETSFGISLDHLATAFVIPEETDAFSFQVKTLESIYSDLDQEIGTSSVRLFVALYTGLPFEITEEIFLPTPAVRILKQFAALTADQLAYIDSHSIEVGNSVVLEPVIKSPVEEHTASASLSITGKTTFRDILDLGVPQAAIESVLADEMPNPLQKIKDYCIENNLAFETIKVALQAELVNLP